MKTVKKTDEWSILEKRSGRYAVRGADGKYVNGDEKLAILAAAGLAKAPPKKKPAPEPAPEAEAASEEGANESEAEGEAPAGS